MGKEIDTAGNIINPIRCNWDKPGGVFITPPGWWHSHHNESDEVCVGFANARCRTLHAPANAWTYDL